MTEKEILKKYPPPGDGDIHQKMWDLMIIDLVQRQNFKKVHLYQLEVLCDLYQEYKNLRAIIDAVGTVATTEGRKGVVMLRNRPEYTSLQRVRTDIALYSKMMGLLLTKDTGMTAEEEQKKEWE